MKAKYMWGLFASVLATSMVEARETVFTEGEYICNDEGYCVSSDNRPISGRIKSYGNKEYVSSEYTNGWRNGLTVVYRQSKLFSKTYYRKGLKNGAERLYYPNRNIKTFANYKDGKLDGRTEQYSEEGKLIGKMTYKEGKITKGYCITDNGRNKDKKKITTAEFNEVFACEEK